MGNFDRNGKRSGSGFGRGFGGGKRFGGGRDGRPAMHQATCSECGASCELPFKPTGDRPVFCSNCFGKQDNAGDRPYNRFSNERRERPRFEDKKMYDAVCVKCGKNCQVPFRPTGDKPVFCSNCFEKGGSANRGSGGGEVIEQIKLLNVKLDKILERLTPAVSVEKNDKAEVKKEIKTKEVVKEKKKETKIKAVAKKSSAKNKK